MPWTRRPLTPPHLPFSVDGLTVDPGLVVESERLNGLWGSPIWRTAPLTKLARDVLPDLLRDAWHVRRLGGSGPIALVLRVCPHTINGRLVSSTPERAALERADRLLVVTADLVLAVRGSDVDVAFMRLAELLLGTRRGPRRRARPATGPVDDLNVLATLAP